MKKLFFSLIVLSFLLSACNLSTEKASNEPTPDIQATAVSIAWTMAAETQTAMPTATLPPTATFTPTLTPTITFTPTPLFTATPIPTATNENEIKMLGSFSGRSVHIKIENRTKSTATISLLLVEGTNPAGYWGYIPVPVLAKNESTSVHPPVHGTYCIYAWMGGQDKKYSINGCYGVNINSDKVEFRLTESGVKFISP